MSPHQYREKVNPLLVKRMRFMNNLGFTDQEIADTLNVSLASIYTHLGPKRERRAVGVDPVTRQAFLASEYSPYV